VGVVGAIKGSEVGKKMRLGMEGKCQPENWESEKNEIDYERKGERGVIK